MKQVNSDFDIVIIGGGVAGIYTAWRLLMVDKADPSKLKKWKKKSKLRIAVFEGSDRIGGRLLSVTPPNFNSVMNCELGGMRFVSTQKYINALIVNKLNIGHPKQVLSEPNNIVYLRRNLLRSYQLGDPDALPYNLTEEEKMVLKSGVTTADNFLIWAVYKLMPGMIGKAGNELKDFLKGVIIDGIELYKYGFWDLVSKVLSHEAYRLAIKTVGYDLLGSNTNAVNLITQLLDFTPTAEFYFIDGSYDSVPWTLQKQFEEAGGKVFMKKWMENFDEVYLEDKTKGVEMNFYKQSKPVNAAALILAMPLRSLELLEQKGPVMDPARSDQSRRLRFLMNSLTPLGLFKMILVYDYPWWEKKAYVAQGRSITDLPARQIFYWGVDVDPKTGNQGKAVLMAYNDVESSTFWSGFRTIPLGPNDDKLRNGDEPPSHILLHKNAEMYKPGYKSVQKSSAASKDPWYSQKLKNWHNHPAPRRMVEEMHKQIMEMHGVSNAPEPIDAVFKNWGDDPYGAAIHFWNSGYKSWEVMPEITKPVKNFPCFICGEAWSENQGWAEGSLQTAEIVLQQHFGLSEPEWVAYSTK
jgi:monoamine oxidase